MNKKGFTLIELLAVFVIMGLIMMMVYPSITKLINDTNIKKRETYEKMIAEYAMVDDEQKSCYALSELLSKSDDLKEIQNNDCDGYAKKKDDKYIGFINCNNEIGVTENYQGCY